MSSTLRSCAPLVSFSDIRALPAPLAADVFAAYTQMFRQLRALLRGPDTAGLSRDDLNARTHIVLSVALWLRTWIGNFEVGDSARTAARVADLLLLGVGAAGAVDALGCVTCDSNAGGEAEKNSASSTQGLVATNAAAAELHRCLPAATPDSVDALYVRPLIEGVLCSGSAARKVGDGSAMAV